uniref:CCHC-type domain-containing protein n=1 Tax=Chelonoidis abingdonii TaxID=106734 RepID=A0A8C0GKY2_CHEAB
MSSKDEQKKERARLQAQDNENKHRRQLELIKAEQDAQEAAHRRDQEAKKADHERKQQEQQAVYERKQQEEKAVYERKQQEEEAIHRRQVELQREAHQQALELERAKQQTPTNPNPPPPVVVPPHRKFPSYKAGEDPETFLENFERVCIGYSIPENQYMLELRSHISGPLADVAAKMPREQMNDYKLFQTQARSRMGITPDHARRRFRNQKWKPEGSFPNHAYYVGKHCDAWISGTQVRTFEELRHLIYMEQFLDGVPEDITRYILDGKPKTLTEAGEIGAKWMEVAESKKATVKGSENPRGHTDNKPYNRAQPDNKPYNRGQPKTPPTNQGKPQTPYPSTSPVFSNLLQPSDPLSGRCYKCNETGHIKANCPKANCPNNPTRVQVLAPPANQRSPGPDTSQIPLERRENLRVGGKKVTAWRDTGAQVSAIHQSFVDPKLINPRAKVTIYPFMSQAVDLPTAELPVQYKGWSGMWTFAVYDNYSIPMLLGEDLANQVKRDKRVGMVTRSQTRQASRPIPVPEPSTGNPSVLPETQTEVVDPDPMPTAEPATAPPVPGPELEQQPAPAPAVATTSSTPTPEGASEPKLEEATDNHTEEAQPEPEIPPGAPAESGSPATETTPSPTSLPEGPSPSPQS